MMVFWTLPFAMLLGIDQRNDGSTGLRKFVRICAAAWLPLVPCIVWAVIYPGLLRRAPDSYVLLMVVPLAIGLTRIAISAKGIFNHRHITIRDSVDADALLAGHEGGATCTHG
ncbi:hypothetical protein [Novosphingobium sp. 9]|uniref:hypothetical protein n=1 Tax=Novosphingobium sp. 9 TaxID=2025349 RepID=UPI0021B57E91|nr:hypothetical protein [Novosphingobium sp. 9]